MDLRSKLRKAAELFVELPPEEKPEPPAGHPPAGHPQAGAPDAGPAAGGEMDELDRRLAAMNRNLQRLGGAPGGQATATGAAQTVEQIVRAAEGPNLDEVNVPASAPPPVVSPEGKVDFSAIYAQANLPAAPFTAEQTLDMLGGLPADLPLEVRRQTVKVTLGAMGKAIGATPETIVADASRKLAALAAYAENVSRQTADTVSAGELEIAALQAQIEQVRRSIEAAKQKQAQVQSLCDTESDRLDDVLEFFSLDVGASRLAPQGGDPSGAAS